MAVNFLLKRSNTASKRPTAAQLDIGELSLNYDANTAGVFFEDSAGNVRKVGPAEVGTAAPNATPAGSSGNSLGELWYDSTASVTNLKIWNGSAFVSAAAGALALAAETFSTSAAVTAGTNAQGQGALTSDYNIITTATANPSGVTLPTATTGRRVIVVNKGANPINVYPATGASIDALAANASLQLGVDAVAIFNAASTTLWYSSVNTQVNAAELTGTIPSGVLGNSSLFVGTTSIALNRASASQSLTGITSIDGSAATLTTTRTLWGQNFNGSANVTGSLTSVGDITGSGAVTLSSAAASALNLNSGTTGAVALDSGTTGAVNIGTNANAKTITIGNATGATSIVLNCGTGALDVGSNAIARTVTVGNTTGASVLNLRAGTGGVAISTGTTGAIGIDSGTTGAINIGTNANAKTITVGNATGATSIVLNCGTGALDVGANAIARTVTVGNTTGASTLNLRGGTGGVAISTGTTGAVTVDSGTTGAINIGNNANAKTITLGNTTGATTINVNSGTGGILVTSPHLTIANQGEIRFREASGGGTNYIGLEAPAAVAADLTFFLPGADATTTTGYTLKSNGSAALSFGTANVVTSDTAPSSPLDGDLWYDSSDGRLFVYYSDGTTDQWVDAAPNNSTANIRQLDDISSQFNGTTTAFTLKIGGANYTPVAAVQLLIAVGGVVQTPGSGYTVSGTTITFTSAPPSGATFSGVVLAEAGFFAAGGTDTQVQYNNAGLMAGTSLMTITTSVNVAADILPTTDNVRNLGSAALRFANVYTGDLHLKNDRGDWTIIEEEDCLTMRNNKTGKVYDIMMKERNA